MRRTVRQVPNAGWAARGVQRHALPGGRNPALLSVRLATLVEISQAELARRLGVSRSHLCDVEKGRKVVSPERASAWAKILGFPPTVFVKLALQEQLDRAGVKMNVEVEAA